MALEYEVLTEKIIAAAITVHSRLGPGFLESIYEKALVIELQKIGLQIEQQKEISIEYDGVEIGRYRLDLLVNNTIVVELKAIKNIENVHFAVVKSYLRAIGQKHGLILNFEKVKLEIKRVIV
jgi:GxxExxY protein